MATNKSPAFQFYTQDWLSDKNVKRLSYRAKGVYIELLAIMWNEGKDSIENDGDLPDILNLSPQEWEEIRVELQKENKEVFIEKDSVFISKRLQKERRKQKKWKKKCSEGGKRSAKVRWGKDIQKDGADKGSYDIVTPPLQVNGNSSSSSSFSSRTPFLIKNNVTLRDQYRTGNGTETNAERFCQCFLSKCSGPMIADIRCRHSEDQMAEDKNMLIGLARHIFVQYAQPGEKETQISLAFTLLVEQLGKKRLRKPMGTFRQAARRMWIDWEKAK